MATMEVKQEFQDDNSGERKLDEEQQLFQEQEQQQQHHHHHHQQEQQQQQDQDQNSVLKVEHPNEGDQEKSGQSNCNKQEHDSSLDNKDAPKAIEAEQETQDDDDGEREDNSETNIPDEEKTNLIVNYLPQQMTDEEFGNLFKKFGPMKSCKIVRNRSSGSSYGFGFVDYETHEQSIKAIEELNGYELDTKRIKVAFARPTGQGIKQANLYVKNVPNGWTEDHIRKVFEPYGKIIQVRVLGNDRGVAFVLYDLRKQAEDALEAMNGHQPEGCDKEFEVRFANEQKEKKLKSEPKKQSNNDNDSATSNSNSRRRNGNRSRDRGGRTNQSDNNNNDNQFGGRGKRQHQQQQQQRKSNFSRNSNNNNNFSNQNNNQRQQNNMGGNNLNGFGPVRQMSSNRMNRYAPFAPVAQPPPITMNPMIMAQPIAQMLPNQVYAAFPGQQPQMIPYGQMMTAPQPQMTPMQTMNPQLTGQNQINMYGAPAVPQAAPLMNAPLTGYNIAQQQNMFSVASSNMANAANLQPHMAMNTSNSGGGGSGGHMGSSHIHGGGGHSGADSGDGVTLFVYNIGPDSDEGALRSMFSSHGQVVKCNVVRKSPGGTTKGFGFVTMKNRAQANAAISGLDGSLHNGRSLQVSLKK